MHQKWVLPWRMDANMSQNTKSEVLEKIRRRYQTAGKTYRIKLIDQAVELMGYHRKSAIRSLGWKLPAVAAMTGRMGRPRLYDAGLLLPALKAIWLIGQQPCGKRLAAMMADWVPAYEGYHHAVESSVREQLPGATPRKSRPRPACDCWRANRRPCRRRKRIQPKRLWRLKWTSLIPFASQLGRLPSQTDFEMSLTRS